MKTLFSKKEWVIIGILVAIKLLAHFLTSTNYDLHRDTFLYYSISQNLDWGFASVPPFVAFITRVSTFLFGYSAFSLNLFPALIGGVSMIIIALIVKELGGKAFAIFVALLAFLVSPAYLRSNSLLQPVSFDQFFWLLSAYFVVKLINTQKTSYWIWILVVWGLGFMNKYLMAGYAVSFVIAILISPHRKLLFSRHFVIGAIIGFIIVLPNIIWQYIHNWAVLHHMSELSQNQLVNVSKVGFLIDQVMMNFPGLLVWFTGLLVFLFFKNESRFRVLSLASLLVVLLLLVTHGKSYYTLGAYTLLFAMGGFAIEKYFSTFFKYFVVVIVILLALPVLPFSLPMLNPKAMADYSKPMSDLTNRWEDGKVHPLPQDYADMTGWKDLSDIVIKEYNSLPPEIRSDCSIYAENYGQAGAIYYYGRQFNLPRPISFSDNFLIWAPDSVTKSNLIYVNDEIGDIKFLFKRYEKVGEVNNPYFRENGVQVYFCSQPSDTFKYFYKEKVKEMKKVYFR